MIERRLLINVHVHKSVTELTRLMDSIAANHCLRQCPVLVVNNAHDQAAAESISQRVATWTFRPVQEINRSSWHRIREAARARLGTPAMRACLSAMELGRPGWNVHDARNVGMITAILLYPERTHVLNFDSDIVVPDDLDLNGSALPEFSCLQLDGCPDLSRLEWIEVYCRLAGMKSGVRMPPTAAYAFRLTQAVDAAALSTILGRYTDLLGPDVCADSGSPSFPCREEYHGACYLVSVSRFAIGPVPWWYDNDWFFFWMIRRLEEEVNFLDGRVLHASTRKNILRQFMLESEEEGKLLNTAYKNGGRDWVGRAIAHRLETIDGVLGFLEVAAGKWPFVAPAVSPERVREVLVALRSRVETFPPARAVAELERFEHMRTRWRACLKGLTGSGDPIEVKAEGTSRTG